MIHLMLQTLTRSDYLSSSGMDCSGVSSELQTLQSTAAPRRFEVVAMYKQSVCQMYYRISPCTP